MINARSETVEEKKTFAKAFRNSRCIFPMSGFYRIYKTDAGLRTESIIMTTKPNNSVSSVHNRMPLIVDRCHIEDWLNSLILLERIYLLLCQN